MWNVLRIGGMCFVLPLFCGGCAESTQSNPPQVGSAPAAEAAAQETIVVLSPKAADQLRKMRDRGKLKRDAVVRIDVVEGNFFRLKNGGEKRYRYTMLIDDDPKQRDQYVAYESEGLTIEIPRTSVPLLAGTQLIWIESGNKGGFQFMNPNQMTDDETQTLPESAIKAAPVDGSSDATTEEPPGNSGRNAESETGPTPRGPTPLDP